MIVIFIEAYRFKEGGLFSKSSAVLLESFQRKRFPSCSYFRRIARPEPPDVAAWIQANNLLKSPPFRLESFDMFDEMVQGCMVMPMAAKPLPWDSPELAALVAYVEQQQKTFKPAQR